VPFVVADTAKEADLLRLRGLGDLDLISAAGGGTRTLDEALHFFRSLGELARDGVDCTLDDLLRPSLGVLKLKSAGGGTCSGNLDELALRSSLRSAAAVSLIASITAWASDRPLLRAVSVQVTVYP
jgi:hypothetical protein